MNVVACKSVFDEALIIISYWGSKPGMSTGLVHRVAFVQPFGLASYGGGPQVLRNLIQDAPFDVVSINTIIGTPTPTDLVHELHLPRRPALGRLERTRLHRWIGSSNCLFSRSFRRRFIELLKREGVTAVHAIAHSWDCFDAFDASVELQLPFILTVHDDILYALKGQAGLARARRLLATMWRQSDLRFVISEEMGIEYSRRYGDRSYLVVTDGLRKVAEVPRKTPLSKLRVYFMGLLHNSYLPNFRALTDALDRIAGEHPGWEIELTARCGRTQSLDFTSKITVQELPFVAEDPTEADMKNADVAYLPMPFGVDEQPFTRYSLSTKMIGYLGSGLPILYHGPSYAAACNLLKKHGAAEIVVERDSDSVATGLYALLDNYENISRSGLGLARSQFMQERIYDGFWKSIGSLIQPAKSLSA
jgi:hypothetical protein